MTRLESFERHKPGGDLENYTFSVNIVYNEVFTALFNYIYHQPILDIHIKQSKYSLI